MEEVLPINSTVKLFIAANESDLGTLLPPVTSFGSRR